MPSTWRHLLWFCRHPPFNPPLVRGEIGGLENSFLQNHHFFTALNCYHFPVDSMIHGKEFYRRRWRSILYIRTDRTRINRIFTDDLNTVEISTRRILSSTPGSLSVAANVEHKWFEKLKEKSRSIGFFCSFRNICWFPTIAIIIFSHTLKFTFCEIDVFTLRWNFRGCCYTAINHRIFLLLMFPHNKTNRNNSVEFDIKKSTFGLIFED